jgi:hypothetical protein
VQEVREAAAMSPSAMMPDFEDTFMRENQGVLGKWKRIIPTSKTNRGSRLWEISSRFSGAGRD